MLKPNFSQYEERYDLPKIGIVLYFRQKGLWGDETREMFSLNCNLLPPHEKAIYSITRFRNEDDVRTSEITRYRWRGKEESLQGLPQDISDLLSDFPEHIKDMAGSTCQH